MLPTKLVDPYVSRCESHSTKLCLKLLGHNHEVGVGGQLPHVLAVGPGCRNATASESVERDGRFGAAETTLLPTAEITLLVDKFFVLVLHCMQIKLA